jgi:hypothetical protein
MKRLNRHLLTILTTTIFLCGCDKFIPTTIEGNVKYKSNGQPVSNAKYHVIQSTGANAGHFAASGDIGSDGHFIIKYKKGLFYRQNLTVYTDSISTDIIIDKDKRHLEILL